MGMFGEYLTISVIGDEFADQAISEDWRLFYKDSETEGHREVLRFG